jgi:4-hydroxy-3-methylbut-2-enyl diphosphate reductase
MRVIRAEEMGMCFGVRDALAILDSVPTPAETTIHGELVHNQVVLEQLRSRGFPMVAEADRGNLPSTPDVLVTAHGISDAERRRLEDAGKRLVDTTCPLVLRAHRAAQGLRNLGYHVLVIGKVGHVEVRGIVEDLESFDVIENADDVRAYPSRRLGVICQTTATERQVQRIRAAVEAANPEAEIRFVDTVCRPTKLRQRSLERLLSQVDAMVIVGGRNSNNTKELVARCRERGIPTLHVQHADELDAQWFEGRETVGLSAGTSTLDTTIEEVHRALVAIEPRKPKRVASLLPA